uniref:Cleavage and polyadenylation specificity factor subunit 2 n=1 Tax=Macrostomum lignano TaxID=282301 RepID=A0A1I8FBB0_9PLAT
IPSIATGTGGVIESYSPDGISVLFTDYGNREVPPEAAERHAATVPCIQLSLHGYAEYGGPEQRRLAHSSGWRVRAQHAVCLNVRLYDEGVYSDMPADALARLVKEAPVPVSPDLSVLNESTGEVTVLPRASRLPEAVASKPRPERRQIRRPSDSNVSDSRSSTPAAAPSVDVEPISENYQLLEPWLAKLVLTGKLDHAACTVTSIIFAARNNNSGAETAATDAPPTVLACVRKPNLLWYRCRLLQRSSTADTCTVLLIDSGYVNCSPGLPAKRTTAAKSTHCSQPMRYIRNHRNQLASMAAPGCALPPVPARYSGGGQRWTRTSAEAMRIIERGEALNNGCPMQRASQQRLAAVDLLLCNSDGQCNRLSSMLRLEGVALRHVEPVAAEALINAWLKRCRKLLRQKRDENLRLRDAEAAATADPLLSRTDAAQCDISAAKEDATPQQMPARNSQNIADKPNSDDDHLMRTETGDWRPRRLVCRCRSSSSRRRRHRRSPQPPTSTSFVSVTAEAANSKPEAEVEAEPEAEAEAEPKLGSRKQNRKRNGKQTQEPENRKWKQKQIRKAEADNAVANNAFNLALLRMLLSDLPSVRPLGDQFRWPNIQVGPLREPIQAKLSHLDCSDERMVIYMQRSDERSEALSDGVAPCAAHCLFCKCPMLSRWCSSLTESGAAVACLTTSESSGLFFLLDIDTGYSK